MTNGVYKILFCSLAVIFSMSATPLAFAKTDVVNAQAIESRYQSLSSWEADFTQTSYIEVLSQNLTKTGRIQVVRPDKLRIDYQSEPEKTYIVNGKMLWVYQPSTQSAQEFKDVQSLISKEALSFLSGLAHLTDLFEVMSDLKEPEQYLKIQDAKLKKITLIPKDPDSAILRLTLGVESKTLTLKEAVVFNASGNVTHYKFDHIKFDTHISDKAFVLPENEKIKITKGKDLN